MTQSPQLLLFVCLAALGISPWVLADDHSPVSPDPQVQVELFAEHPQLVTPTGLAVDDRGRVFVAESHTHFRPDDYDGPKADRILIFEDTDSDGRADQRSIFHEGFTHVMDIEFHRDGSLYVATRMDIHRLRDTNGDDRADQVDRIVYLDTKGNYPHNGLSGIAFDLSGGFHFGLGENLGEPYRVIGSDGTSISGGGEGGSTYWVEDDGKHLRRVSTGWWNPYGMCTDSFGRVFGTDNDPDASPPCRLIQVIQDGNYGYEFRYGRSGRNPLVAWNGEIPGTLPMIAGTGEAPCHMVAYESDALPDKYFGALMVPSWADHRVEYYVLDQRSDRGLVETRRQVLVEGPDDFRPVGIDVAPDGSIFVSDWVSSSYTLHKLGRIWRIRPAQQKALAKSSNAPDSGELRDRRRRQAVALKSLKSTDATELVHRIGDSNALPQARATWLQIAGSPSSDGMKQILRELVSDQDQPIPLRVLAVRQLFRSANQDQELLERIRSDQTVPTAVRAEAYLVSKSVTTSDLDTFRKNNDPLLLHSAYVAAARMLSAEKSGERSPIIASLSDSHRVQVIRRAASVHDSTRNALSELLKSSEPKARFAAIKWVSDEQLAEHRPQLEAILNNPALDLPSFLAIQVALLRLDHRPITDHPPADRLVGQIFSKDTSPAIRQISLRLIDPAAPQLKLAKLAELIHEPDASIRLEAVRTIAQHPDEGRFELLLGVARDSSNSPEVRAAAIAGLVSPDANITNALVELASDPVAVVQHEALRSLVGQPLTAEDVAKLKALAISPTLAEPVARVVDKTLPDKPPANEIDEWLKLVPETGVPANGERIFFGLKVGTCSKCHQANGRGASVGPDLSRISARASQSAEDGRRWLLETILLPSRDMAPQYTPWAIVTKDGKQLTGLPRRKGGNHEAYLGSDGKEFTLTTDQIEYHRESDVSIMPADLLQQLTLSEIADLMAYLRESE